LIQGISKSTALMAAVARTEHDYHEENMSWLSGNTRAKILAQRYAVAKILLAAGADADLCNHNGTTALVLAAIQGPKNMLCTCILAAANPRALECSICGLDGGAFTALDSCGHFFHTKCIKNWFNQQLSEKLAQLQPISLTCPLCRSAHGLNFSEKQFFLPSIKCAQRISPQVAAEVKKADEMKEAK
jgi:hypothetical protein